MTPTGESYIDRDMAFCACQTEAERLICCAESFYHLHGVPPRDAVIYQHTHSDKDYRFRTWYYQLALDFNAGPRWLVFRAIMEDWPRSRILGNLRGTRTTRL